MSFIGRFVALPNEQGFAKLVSMDNENASVEIFYSVARQETIDCRTKDLSWGFLAKQTRVYCKNDIGYDIGRVTDFLEEQELGVVYTVRFPNKRERDIREQDLYVRPWSSPEDPVAVFGMHASESQFLYDRRQPFVHSVTKLRNAAYGIDAISSANVELVDHQIKAVQRILSDPVQRYLLADEVGMGKTIEAGLVAKQRLIDDTNNSIGICVPAHLISQWENELFVKLGLEEYRDQLLIFSHDQIEFYHEKFDVFIIDEAHNITSFNDPDSSKVLSSNCAQADTLLLLTATPPMSDYVNFYKLLQLLDPEQYSNEEYAAFKKKVEDRVEIGRVLLSLGRGTSPTVLRLRANKLITDFAEDPLITQLATELINACDYDQSKIEESALQLKTLIAEKYRISQRIIRSRRQDTQGWEFQTRGPSKDLLDTSHIRIEELYSEDYSNLNLIMEEWRSEALSHIVNDDGNLQVLAQRFRELLYSSACDPNVFKQMLDQFETLFDGEEILLNEMKQIMSSINGEEKSHLVLKSIERLVRQLTEKSTHPCVVMFLPNELIRDRLLALAKATFNDFEIISSEYIINDDQSLGDVLSKRTRPTLLLLDAHHDEGLNLSYADALVHYDLLFDVSRLEQRIGRIDRFGRTKGAIKHRIIIPSENENSYWHLWVKTLIEGFGIFHGSVSNVQFLISELNDNFFGKLLELGVSYFDQGINEISQTIEKARREQDEQFALDRITNEHSDSQNIIADIETVEEHEDELQATCESWLFNTLKLSRRLVNSSESDLFNIKPGENTLIPLSPWMKQIDVEQTSQLTWKRYKAIVNPGVQLLRPGCTLFDQLERFTRWDDRGRVFATHRKVLGWQSDELIFFKLDISVSPGFQIQNLLNPSMSEKAILRKLNIYFPRQQTSLYLDFNCRLVTDQALISFLNGKYDKRRDTNLSSRPELFNQYLDLHSHKVIAQSMYQAAVRIVENDEDLQLVKKKALSQIIHDRRQFDVVYSERDRKQKNVMFQEALLETIHDSLSNLKYEVDAFGCFVLGA